MKLHLGSRPRLRRRAHARAVGLAAMGALQLPAAPVVSHNLRPSRVPNAILFVCAQKGQTYISALPVAAALKSSHKARQILDRRRRPPEVDPKVAGLLRLAARSVSG